MITCQTHDTIPADLVSNDPSRPRFSISQVSTLTASFADDVRVYAAGGLDAIGIWEMKLGDGPTTRRSSSSPQAASAPPPQCPKSRRFSRCRCCRARTIRRSGSRPSAHRSTGSPQFAPTAIVCLTGPAGDRDRDEARALAVDGLRTIAAEAERAGMRMALEPFQLEGIENWSLVNTIPDAVELIDEVGSPAFGIQFDVWHLWNTPDLLDEIERHIHRFAGVHVNDWREPTRGWADRALPGHGAANLAAILGALDAAGWGGYYDMEIFSDNGAFGTAYPDSLWDADPAELVRQGRESFARCWQERRVAA